MKEKHRWPTTTIRINPDILHQARIAAVTERKTLGQWLEEAILQKIEKVRSGRREDENESNIIR
jgi:predicted HicB family RNase H-like nuclease